MTDSHGMDLESYLTVLALDRYAIFSICSPSANFTDVVVGQKLAVVMRIGYTIVFIERSNDFFSLRSSVLSKVRLNYNFHKIILQTWTAHANLGKIASYLLGNPFYTMLKFLN